ncbi:hypothetical protein C2W64_04399 [Brevibacillus laterosporus]|nr:hypothetical protein C2W64_04399 [Brevibacillus laterosporus]
MEKQNISSLRNGFKSLSIQRIKSRGRNELCPNKEERLEIM